MTAILISEAMMLGGRPLHYAEIRSRSHKRAGCELDNRPACKHFWKIKQHATECSDTTTSDTRKRCWIGRNCCHSLGCRRQQNGIFGPHWVFSILEWTQPISRAAKHQQRDLLVRASLTRRIVTGRVRTLPARYGMPSVGRQAKSPQE